MAVTDVGSGPTTRLSIWPERTDAHASLYGVQAWAANYELKVQTTVGAWAPGWVPSTPKQYPGVSVHSRAQQASELRGSVAETLQGGWNSALCSGIVQLWPVSPILFLFFNKDLVNFCVRSTGKVSGIRFVDNVNILVVSKDTESNCRTLEWVHHSCTTWAHCHGAAFTPHKYKLMHLT